MLLENLVTAAASVAIEKCKVTPAVAIAKSRELATAQFGQVENVDRELEASFISALLRSIGQAKESISFRDPPPDPIAQLSAIEDQLRADDAKARAAALGDVDLSFVPTKKAAQHQVRVIKAG